MSQKHTFAFCEAEFSDLLEEASTESNVHIWMISKRFFFHLVYIAWISLLFCHDTAYPCIRHNVSPAIVANNFYVHQLFKFAYTGKYKKPSGPS